MQQPDKQPQNQESVVQILPYLCIYLYTGLDTSLYTELRICYHGIIGHFQI